MLAVTVSTIDNCDYCVTHHNDALRIHSKEERLEENLRKLDLSTLSAQNREMLEYAVKLTKSPGEVRKIDVDKLGTVGFSDEEILRINLIVGYFNFVNRIVSGLGVKLEPKDARLYKY